MELIQAAYRTLAKLHHLDKGGETTQMVEINDAYHLVIATLKADTA